MTKVVITLNCYYNFSIMHDHIVSFPRKRESIKMGLSLFLVCTLLLSNLAYANPDAPSLQIWQNDSGLAKVREVMEKRRAHPKEPLEVLERQLAGDVPAADTTLRIYSDKEKERILDRVNNNANGIADCLSSLRDAGLSWTTYEAFWSRLRFLTEMVSDANLDYERMLKRLLKQATMDAVEELKEKARREVTSADKEQLLEKIYMHAQVLRRFCESYLGKGTEGIASAAYGGLAMTSKTTTKLPQVEPLTSETESYGLTTMGSIENA